MSTTRHDWLNEYHAADPHQRSISRPLTIVASQDVDVELDDGNGGAPEILRCSSYDFLFPYRDMDLQPRTGRGRMFLPAQIGDRPERRSVPMVVSIHYEADINWARGFLAEGWPCMTPIEIGDDHGFNLIGAGMDHTLEFVRLARRLEFVDLQRIGWWGGSAGGYQCLMALESIWPVAGAIADVPISDVWYDLQVLEHSNRYNEGITEYSDTVLPASRAVYPIVEGTARAIGDDLDKAWQNSAPPAAALIRSPTLIYTITGDLLCFSPQIGRDYEHTPARGVMPPGWSHSYERYCHPESLGKPLVEWIPRDDLETICVAVPPTAPHVEPFEPPEGVERPPQEPFKIAKPFSRSRLVTVVVQDEGAPDPHCMHSKTAVAPDSMPFFQHHLARGYVPPEHLTPLLLTRLIGRFNPDTPQSEKLPPIRRGYEGFDRWEVLLALRTFIGEPVRAGNLEALRTTYAELPPVQRGLDVERDGVCASFADDPVAAILYHEAALLRGKGETSMAEEREAALARDHGASAWATLSVEQE